MKNVLPKVCYWCGIELTKETIRREHLPPLGFFPKGHRENLMTVPSCEQHNNCFSNIDEKFQIYLKLHKSNSIAENEVLTKVKRSIERKEKQNFVNDFNSKTGFGFINEKKYLVTQLTRYEADHFIEKIIRGLYFYHIEKPTKGKVQWASKFIQFEGLDSNAVVDNMMADERLFRNGDFNNRQVFQYKFFDHNNTFCVILNFYEGIKFIGWVLPEKFTYENFDPRKYGYTSEDLEELNSTNNYIFPKKWE